MKHYTDEFKRKAVVLSEEIGCRDAAEQLGVSYYTLSDWRRRKNIRPEESQQREEYLPDAELPHEVHYLREANALLQRTVDYLLTQQV